MSKKGTGTVVKIGGKFYARWRIKGKDVYGEAKETWEAADIDRANNRPSQDAPIIKRGEIPTLQNWAFHCSHGLYGGADTSHDTNETIRIRHLEGTELGKSRLDKVSKPMCQRWVDGIMAKKSKGERVWKESASPSYKRRAAAYVSRLFTLAIEHGYRKESPMKGVKLPDVEERENRVLSPAEALPLLNPTRRIDVLMLTAILTGMRRSELARLEWSHVGKDRIKIPGTKTSRSRAYVPLTDEVREALALLPKHSQYVFATESGKMMGLRNINRDVSRRKQQLGIPAETRLQDLRGSFVSLLLESGSDIRTVMELARHTNARTTLGMYARSRFDVKQAAVEGLRLKLGAAAVDDTKPKSDGVSKMGLAKG